MSSPAAAPTLALSTQRAASGTLPGRADLRRWAAAAQRSAVEVTIRFVDAEEGRRLSRDFRQQDHPTNVLTFAYGGEPLSGDLVLCVPVVEREAREMGIPLDAHFAHLVVHGMLHLQGYDHIAEADAAAMEAVESFVMMRLGYPDPYAPHA